MSEKLGRYRLGVVPIKNAAGTDPDTYWREKKRNYPQPVKKHAPVKECCLCGRGRIPNVAKLKWQSDWQAWYHKPCLDERIEEARNK